MNDLPERLRSLAASLDGDQWEHPIMAREACLRAADAIERLMAVCKVAAAFVALDVPDDCPASGWLGCIEQFTADRRRLESRLEEAIEAVNAAERSEP